MVGVGNILELNEFMVDNVRHIRSYRFLCKTRPSNHRQRHKYQCRTFHFDFGRNPIPKGKRVPQYIRRFPALETVLIQTIEPSKIPFGPCF